MANPKWPAFAHAKGAKLDNEKSHGHRDPNGGGGPAAPVMRNEKRIPDASRGGPYQSGQRQYASTSIHGGRGGTGNPADRGSMPSVGRQSFPSETRNPNGGGGVQERSNFGPVRGGGFGTQGTAGLPGARPTNPKPGAGNVGGRAFKKISRGFRDKASGGGNIGQYGDRAPITSNT